MREPFSLTNIHNFGDDQRTRIMLFVTGIELLPSENLAAVQVQLEDSERHTVPLVVEGLRKLPDFPNLSQIVVRLPDTIQTEGDYRISVTFRGTTGNRPLIGVHN